MLCKLCFRQKHTLLMRGLFITEKGIPVAVKWHLHLQLKLSEFLSEFVKLSEFHKNMKFAPSLAI